MWVFFRLLGPAVLLEEQHSLWKYYRTLVKKTLFLVTLALCVMVLTLLEEQKRKRFSLLTVSQNLV